jgi:hypothetical protein
LYYHHANVCSVWKSGFAICPRPFAIASELTGLPRPSLRPFMAGHGAIILIFGLPISLPGRAQVIFRITKISVCISPYHPISPCITKNVPLGLEPWTLDLHSALFTLHSSFPCGPARSNQVQPEFFQISADKRLSAFPPPGAKTHQFRLRKCEQRCHIRQTQMSLGQQDTGMAR